MVSGTHSLEALSTTRSRHTTATRFRACLATVLRVLRRFLQTVGMVQRWLPGSTPGVREASRWRWEQFLASKTERHGKGRVKGYMVMYERSDPPPLPPAGGLDIAIADICAER